MLHICLTNTKGGVAKSTLASQLSIWLHDRRIRVALLDVDPQGTSAGWVAKAEPGIAVRRAGALNEIQQIRADLMPSTDVVVIDTPGNDHADLAQAATIFSDVVLIPLQPSTVDLRELKHALTYVKLGQELSAGQKPQATIIVTLTSKGDLQTRQLRSDLAAFQMPVARSEVRRLNALRDGFGQAVIRNMAPDAKLARLDLTAVFEEVVAPHLTRITAAPRAEAANE